MSINCDYYSTSARDTTIKMIQIVMGFEVKKTDTKNDVKYELGMRSHLAYGIAGAVFGMATIPASCVMFSISAGVIVAGGVVGFTAYHAVQYLVKEAIKKDRPNYQTRQNNVERALSAMLQGYTEFYDAAPQKIDPELSVWVYALHRIHCNAKSFDHAMSAESKTSTQKMIVDVYDFVVKVHHHRSKIT